MSNPHDFRIHVGALEVAIQYEPPPIPVRDADWSAHLPDSYEPGDPIGRGRTRDRAVEDLWDQLEVEWMGDLL